MPKNVVGRLLNLENEMKNVLSICELSKTDPKPSSSIQKTETLLTRNSLGQTEHKRSNSVKSINDRTVSRKEEAVEKPIQKKTWIYQRRNPLTQKPNSAPSSALTKVKESEKNKSKRLPAQSGHKSGEGVASADSLEWFDCSPQECETPEHTVKPAERASTDRAWYKTEKFVSKISVISCQSCRKRKSKCACHDKQREKTLDDFESKESFLHYIKPNLRESKVINELTKKLEKKEIEAMATKRQDRFKTVRRTSQSNESQEEVKNVKKSSKDIKQPAGLQKGSTMGITKKQGVSPTRIARPVTAPTLRRKSEKPSPKQEVSSSRDNSVHDDAEENSSIVAGNSEDTEKNKLSECEFDHLTENENIHSVNYCTNDRNYVKWVKNVVNEQEESLSEAESSGKQIQNTVSLMENKNLSEARDRKIGEIIEENNAKIEKMRRSKNVAVYTIKYMKEKYDELAEIKNDLAEKLELVIERNEQLMRELQESEELKQTMLQELENQRQMNCSVELMNQIQSLNEENFRRKEKIQFLEEQMQEMISEESRPKNTILMNEMSQETQINRDRCYEYHILFKRQEVAYRRLVQGISVLEKVIRNNKEKAKRLSGIKAELKRRALKSQCYLEKLTAEKEDLFQVVNELRAFVEENQSRIKQLENDLRRKDEELENKKKLVEEKCETLEETIRELESIRQNSIDLENQVKTLRNSIEQFDQMHHNLLKERQGFEETVQRMSEEKEKLQEHVSAEKDSIRIKNKIIEDQQETIKNLREKVEEAKAMTHKIQSLERMIDIEREDKLELQETIEGLRAKNDELEHKVKSLEADLLLAPQEVVRDLQKTQNVLHELENQVQTKQREWEGLLQSLAKEKEQACSVAVFATKKLIQTASDFQKQSDAHKKLYKLLTDNMMEKRYLHESTERTKQNVRFSEDLHQITVEDYEEEEERHAERFRHQMKQMGILKKSREWFDGSPESSSCCRGRSAYRTDIE